MQNLHTVPQSAKLFISILGVVNGKSETRRDAETGIFKSETETEKFSDLIEKHIIYETDRYEM